MDAFHRFLIQLPISLRSSMEQVIHSYVCGGGGLSSDLHVSLSCSSFPNGGGNVQLVQELSIPSSDHLSSGAIAALVICLVGIPLLITCILLYIRFRKPSLWKRIVRYMLFWKTEPHKPASSSSSPKISKEATTPDAIHPTTTRRPSTPMLQVHPHSSLRQLTRARLLDDMLYSLQSTGGKWKVMVVDKRGLRILSAACRMNDLISRGITLVESLEAIRDPLPMLDVIYFMSPNDESFLNLIADQNTQLDWAPSLYNAIHIFSSNRISESLLQCIHSIGGRRLLSKLVTLKEIQVDYLAVGENVYHLDRPDSISQLYGANSEKRNKEMECSACQFCTLLSVLSSFVCPGSNFITTSQVEWILGSDNNRSSKSMDNARTNNNNNNNITGMNSSGNQGDWILQQWLRCVEQECQVSRLCNSSVLEQRRIFVDTPIRCWLVHRTSDLITPLLHDLSVENICLEMKEYGDWIEGVPLPDDSDEYWSLLRYERVSSAAQWISQRLEDLISQYHRESRKSNTAMSSSSSPPPQQVNPQDSMNLHQMAKLVRQIPQYQEEKAKLTKYIDLLQRCIHQVEKRKLIELSQLEQDIACGMTAHGKSIQSGSSKWQELVETTERILTDAEVKAQDKGRLILLWSLCWGLSTTQRNRWLSMASLQENVLLVRALAASDMLSQHWDSQKERKKRREETKRLLAKKKQSLHISENDSEAKLYERMTPALVTELENILSRDAKKYDSEKEEERKGRPTSQHHHNDKDTQPPNSSKSVRRSRSRRRTAPSDTSPRAEEEEPPRRLLLLLLVLGGISIYEIRALRLLAERHNIHLIIGGSCILTGESYLSQLSLLG